MREQPEGSHTISPYSAQACWLPVVGAVQDSSGSSGWALDVTPQPKEPFKAVTTGPIVVLRSTDGGTSGRFTVARIIARVFPAHEAFVRKVMNEGLERASDFPFGPYPTDKLTARTEDMVEYETPPHSKGLGTDTGMTPDDNPVQGAAVLQNGEWPCLRLLSVRLPPDMKRMTTDIIQQFERESLTRPSAEPSPGFAAGTSGEGSEAAGLSSRECPSFWQALVSGTSYFACRRQQEEAQRAEVERKRQAEEKARELKEALGDEIEAQVGYVGLVDAATAAVLANNPSLAKTWGLDRMLGYQIQDLRMFINRKNGSLTITFGCRFNNGTNAPARMLVRLFDGNGKYLTHFVTAEYLAAPRWMGVLGKSRYQGPKFIELKQDSNVLQYSVNLRDAAYVQMAEFGLYTGQ